MIDTKVVAPVEEEDDVDSDDWENDIEGVAAKIADKASKTVADHHR